MNQVWEFFQKLFDTADFPPRWHCGRWTEFHGWLYIISDLAIWAAYFAIPLIIIRIITRKSDARFVRVYFLFAAFILACGSTHLIDAITFWYPYYRVNALVHFFTAIVSWATVFSLVRIVPAAFTLKTAKQLEAEIEQRQKAEEQLRINNALLMEAQAIAKLGHWQWNVETNKVTWSDSMAKMFGSDGPVREMTYEEYLQRILPEERPFVSSLMAQALETKEFPPFYHKVLHPGGQMRIILGKGEVISDSSGQAIKMIGTAQDVTEQRNSEQELLLKTQMLEATNIELQKFASIASHDLREPLRKIITFGSMLEREYKDTLGEKGNTYLEKMTGSALRMQKLIDDILDFSKLTVNTQQFAEADLNEVVAQVLSDMEVAINKSGAQILTGFLPKIEGNASQLGQLFQNLLSNAIKFRKPDVAPVVQITAEVVHARSLPKDITDSDQINYPLSRSAAYKENREFCSITVKDNGIGFDESYLDRIFLIFQRLHNNTEYEGTGVGLAICKKVVDLHNGYITAYSKPGEGATFIIVLPLKQERQEEYSSIQEHNGSITAPAQ